MAFDYKKEYKEFYLPKKTPEIIEIPPMNFIAVRGQGDPNLEGGDYKRSIGLLYGIAYTIKMSKMGDHRIDGYFDFVVPPLEGLWQHPDNADVTQIKDKNAFKWISMIRLPDFVKEEDFKWAVREASEKKKTDFSEVEFFHYEEGLCVQCMHVGPYDDEPTTVQAMNAYAKAHGVAADFSDIRLHHEIYLSDPRKGKPENLKTVIRQPVRKIGE